VGIHRCREHCDKCAICDKQRWRGALCCGDVGLNQIWRRFGVAETVKLSFALAIERRNSSWLVPPTSTCSGGVTWGDIPSASTRPRGPVRRS
jgi:hypothetical protein